MATKQFIGNVRGQKGEKGVSITSVKQTTTSDIDGGINEITVTLSDGRKETFQVANGNTGKKGDQGVSVKTVAQTTTSNADGGSNVMTVTLSDGTQAKFTVKNGNKGDKGDKGDTGDLSEECADARTSATGKSYDDLKARLDVEYNFLDTKANCIEGETSGDTITDSANAPLAYMKNSGYTEQKTLSGKNLLTYPYTYKSRTYNGITFADAGDGTITLNGTAEKDAECCMKSPMDVPLFKLSVGDYIYTCEGVKDDASYYSNIYYYDNKGFRNLMCTVTKDSPNGIISITNEIFENYQAIILEIVVKNGVTVSNVVLKPMITLANVTDRTYEPYCGGIASPNPKYPQEIKGLGDSGTIEVKTCGKNLFDYTSIANRFSNNANGTKHTYSDGEFVITRVANNNSGVYSYANELNIFKGKKIRVTLDAKTNTDGMNISVALGGLSYVVKAITTSYTRYSFDFDLSDVANGYPFVIYGNAVAGNMYIKDIMFEDITKEVSTDDTYEPYTETQALIPVSSPLYNGDYIEVFADGSGQIVRTMGSAVYDGSESGWNKGGSANGLFYILKPTNSKASPTLLFCSHYVKSTSGTTYTTDKTTNINTGNYWIIDSRFSTVDGWKTWLQSNPITVVYELATPTTEPLTAEQVAEFMKLRTYKTTTYINADGEKVVRYVVDTKTYIDNKFAELQALMNV